MRSHSRTFAIIFGLLGLPGAVAAQPAVLVQTTPAAPTAVAVPEELRQFSGMMIGRLVDRDLERGSFTVTVDYVPRVWRNNKAKDPRAATGKTLRVEGVSGKWLDQLLLVRPGETVEFEAQHRDGDALRFPGELLRKTEPFDPAKHPVPPAGFRGFSGILAAKVHAKHPTSRELVLEVQKIEETSPGNHARKPETVIGKQIVLAGFWGGMSKPFDPLRAGDTIRVGVLHRVPQSDHFSVVGFAEKVTASPDREPPDSSANGSTVPAGMRGFRGILRGRLVSRDLERGQLVFTAERATRVWKQSRASEIDSCRGKQFTVKGITGKWLDVLLAIKAGDQIEVEAFHNGGDHLDFVSEWLKKVE